MELYLMTKAKVLKFQTKGKRWLQRHRICEQLRGQNLERIRVGSRLQLHPAGLCFHLFYVFCFLWFKELNVGIFIQIYMLYCFCKVMSNI